MTVYIKNIINQLVPIYSLDLTIAAGDTRKIIADFDIDYVSAKNELDVLIDEKKIELIDDMGQEVSSSEVFSEVIDQNTINKVSEEIQTENTKIERFYYLEDIFCISKGGTVFKTFKGKVDTFRISAKNKSIKYRIKSQGIVMPWQYLKQDKEITLNFEYRLTDPIFELLSDAGDSAVNIYVDGYVTNINTLDLQNFMDTWYENQTACSNTEEWYGAYLWWNENKIVGGEWANWDWSDKIGIILDKKINLYELSIDTRLVQQSDGAKLVIPSNYQNLDGTTYSEFKIFNNDELGVFTIELIEYNDWTDWNPNHFYMKVKNVRYIKFLDQMFDLTNLELPDWSDRWVEPHYYASTGLKFISSSGSFKSSIGSYTVDLNGKPKSVTLLFSDSSVISKDEPITSLASNEYDFFIIANGADIVNDSSVISFDNSSTYPTLLIDDVASDLPVYFSDPLLNYDGKDHFIYESDGIGGTNIRIEDLPNGGDNDFNDIVLNVNFPMTDKIIIFTPETIESKFKQIGKNGCFGLKTKYNGIRAYALGKIELNNEECNVWKLRNGSNNEINVRFQDYHTGKNTFYTIPAKTDLYITTDEETEMIKMEWFDDARRRYSRPRKSYHKFRSNINLKKETYNDIVEIDSTTYYN